MSVKLTVHIVTTGLWRVNVVGRLAIREQDGHRLRSFVTLLQKVADFALTSAESCLMPIPRHSSGNSNIEIRRQFSAFIVICDELLVRDLVL